MKNTPPHPGTISESRTRGRTPLARSSRCTAGDRAEFEVQPVDCSHSASTTVVDKVDVLSYRETACGGIDVDCRLVLHTLPWFAELSGLKERLFDVFRRSEARQQVELYLDGLIGGVERKNGWQLAEYAGEEAPWRMQAVLGRSFWDAERARDICRDYVVDRLGEASGVLVLDETGFVKKGTHSVGVARQYSGTAGRIENCQIGVFLGYASRKGHALIDRRLYLPKPWVEDMERRKKTHVPDDIVFATKPKIGIMMVEAALDAGVPSS